MAESKPRTRTVNVRGGGRQRQVYKNGRWVPMSSINRKKSKPQPANDAVKNPKPQRSIAEIKAQIESNIQGRNIKSEKKDPKPTQKPTQTQKPTNGKPTNGKPNTNGNGNGKKSDNLKIEGNGTTKKTTTTQVKPTQVKPTKEEPKKKKKITAADRMRARNEEIHGKSMQPLVDKHSDFKKHRKAGTLKEFAKKYPNSQTAKRLRKNETPGQRRKRLRAK